MSYLFLILVIAVVAAVLAIAMFTNFRLDDEHYDRLKWIVIRWSYLVTFIGLVVKTFAVPYGAETVILVGGIGAMLAGLLGISNQAYENMQRIINTEDHDEDQELMAEAMLEEDEQQIINGEE